MQKQTKQGKRGHAIMLTLTFVNNQDGHHYFKLSEARTFGDHDIIGKCSISFQGFITLLISIMLFFTYHVRETI